MSEVMDLALAAKQESELARPAAPAQPVSVVEHAMRGGATPEQMMAVMQLQVQMDNHKLDMLREKRRMDEEDRKAAALLAFRESFAGFRGENVIIPKDKRVDRGRAGSFFQAEFDSVCRLLSPALSKHGFSFRHDQTFGAKPVPTEANPHACMGWVTVTCYLEHRQGHVETLMLEGPEGDQSANTPVQNMQVTASYLKRQSLLALTGTATAGEDNEKKLRNRSAGQDEPADDGDDEQDALLDAGRDAAMKGMQALTAWWSSLTSKQRADLSPDFPGLRKAATAADQQGAGK